VFQTDEALGGSLGRSLASNSLEIEVVRAFNPLDSVRLLQSKHAEMVILAPSAVDTALAFEVARRIRDTQRSIPLLFVTSNSSEDVAIAALRAGINEYIKHPFLCGELSDAVERCIRSRSQETAAAGADLPDLKGVDRMVGESTAMRQVRAYLTKLASTDSNVLITGETGTGKELVAKLLHRNSPRQGRSFMVINSAAIPDTLFESELFGYEKGAFTGAQVASTGKLKAADGGTIFLDEVGDMSSFAQAKILRVIERKEIQRLGGRHDVAVDVRIIAATNQDLERLVREEKFRKDLFFRLNVTRIHLPPLRDRKEDIPALLEYYIRDMNRRFERRVNRIKEEALEHLLAYDWPGNVRELRNLLEAIFAIHPLVELSLDNLPAEFRARCETFKALPRDERERLLWALLSTNWNKSKAADRLHWSRMTLYRKIARYHIVKTKSPIPSA